MNGKNKLIILLVLIVGIAIGMFLKGSIFSTPQSANPAVEAAHDEHGDHDEEEGEEHGEEVVRLNEDELQEFGLELATAGEGQIQLHIDLTGEIKIDPDRLAHIIPRFPGIVKEVRKKIGDKVKKGEVLAIIESNESLAPYEVTSLIDGTVIEMHITKGEVINDQSHDIVVADLSHVWADFSIYQKDLQYIDIGQVVEISAGSRMPTVTGRISYISPVVDEATRTAIARVVIPNPEGRWRPGLFVNGRVITETVTAPVVIPKTALETFEDRTVVFVKTEEGFKPLSVKLGRNNRVNVEVVAGLQPGQTYVARGGFTLKAELQKGAFGDGHGH